MQLFSFFTSTKRGYFARGSQQNPPIVKCVEEIWIPSAARLRAAAKSSVSQGRRRMGAHLTSSRSISSPSVSGFPRALSLCASTFKCHVWSPAEQTSPFTPSNSPRGGQRGSVSNKNASLCIKKKKKKKNSTFFLSPPSRLYLKLIFMSSAAIQVKVAGSQDVAVGELKF